YSLLRALYLFRTAGRIVYLLDGCSGGRDGGGYRRCGLDYYSRTGGRRYDADICGDHSDRPDRSDTCGDHACYGTCFMQMEGERIMMEEKRTPIIECRHVTKVFYNQ